jgi:hypothetical protein
MGRKDDHLSNPEISSVLATRRRHVLFFLFLARRQQNHVEGGYPSAYGPLYSPLVPPTKCGGALFISRNYRLNKGFRVIYHYDFAYEVKATPAQK